MIIDVVAIAVARDVRRRVWVFDRWAVGNETMVVGGVDARYRCRHYKCTVSGDRRRAFELAG